MHSTMMDVPLSLNHLLDRAGHDVRAQHDRLAPARQVAAHATPTREYHRRTRALAVGAAARSGCSKGDRVATLCWNHHAHLEAYFGIPAAGGVMHTLNLRLSPDEIGWIAADAQGPLPDRRRHPAAAVPAVRRTCTRSSSVIVFPFSGAPVPAEFDDYEALLAGADADGFAYAPHDENDPVAMCYTSGTTGRPKGVAYSHRSTVLHTLVGCLADHWGLKGTDVLMPVTPMFHANSWGMPVRRGDDGREAGLPRPAPAPRRPARPDAGRAADAVAGRADDLAGPDPGLRARR